MSWLTVRQSFPAADLNALFKSAIFLVRDGSEMIRLRTLGSNDQTLSSVALNAAWCVICISAATLSRFAN
jgi:hypothetical protein